MHSRSRVAVLVYWWPMKSPTSQVRAATFGEPDGDRIPVVLATEFPVERDTYTEVLSHASADHVDLTRAPLPLIVSHERTSLPVGLIEDIRVDTKRRELRGYARFANTEEGREIRESVLGKFIRSVSVGYQLLRELAREGRTRRFSYMPLEASVVSVPADPGAGFYRSARSEVSRMTTQFSDKPRLPDFLDMSQREIAQYDLLGWLRNNTTKRAPGELRMPPSLVSDCHQEICKRLGRSDNGIANARIPRDILAQQRTMSASPGSKGGYLIGHQMSFMEGFYAANVALELGMRSIDAFEGQVSFAGVKSGTSVAWLGPDGTASASTPQFGTASGTPRTAVAIEVASESFLRQIGPEGQSFLLADLGMAMGAAIGAAAIGGTGAEQPLGILNVPGVGTVTATSLDWSDACDMIEDVHMGNVKNRAATGWAGAPDVEGILRKRERFSGGGVPIWNDDTIAGRRALSSNAVPAGALIYGSWTELVLLNWGGLRIEVNPYYQFNSNAAGIRAVWDCDVVARNPAMFSVATSIT